MVKCLVQSKFCYHAGVAVLQQEHGNILVPFEILRGEFHNLNPFYIFFLERMGQGQFIE